MDVLAMFCCMLLLCLTVLIYPRYTINELKRNESQTILSFVSQHNLGIVGAIMTSSACFVLLVPVATCKRSQYQRLDNTSEQQKKSGINHVMLHF